MQTQWLPTALHQWWAEVHQYSILGKIVVVIVVTVIASSIVATLIAAIWRAWEDR